jgi:hypothetical protein
MEKPVGADPAGMRSVLAPVEPAVPGKTELI